MGKELFLVRWRKELIGHLTVSAVDMWYWDCLWQSNHSPHATDFEKLASSFNIQEVMKNPAKGTLVVLTTEQNPGDQVYALVLFLDNNLLSIRIAGSNDGKQWMIDNIH